MGNLKKFDREKVLQAIKEQGIVALKDYNLRDANLYCADLRDANLHDADLRDADLHGADLRDANLHDADLHDADLHGADLRDANLRDADLRGADLRDANLRDADLEYSCWPLWCGSLGVITDERVACQLAYHLCSLKCDSPEYLKMRNSILDFANKFHRVDECGKLEVIEISEESEN